MQFTTKLFDINAQGFGTPSNIQKIAVKMPANGMLDGTDGQSRFSEIMAALFGMSAEQIETSLGHLETMEMDDSSTQAVPLIDLTKILGDQEAPDEMSAGDAGTETEAGTSASGIGLSGADIAEIIAGIIGRRQAHGAVPGTDIASQNRETSDGTAQGAFLERTAEKMLQGETENGAFLLKDSEINTKNGVLFKYHFNAERGGEKPVAENASPADAKSPGAELFQKRSMIDGEMEAEADTESPFDDAAKSDSAFHARIAAGRGKTDQGLPQADVPGQEGGKATSLDNQQNMEGVTRLRDSDVKERIKPQDAFKDPAPFTNANQTGSNAASGTSSAQTHLNSAAPSPETMEGSKMTIQSPQKNTEGSAPAKEMDTNVIHQIVQRMSLRSDGRQSQMQIRLKPEFLGNLRMDVITENRLVMVRMTAESHSVKEMIEKNIGLLKTELQQHGLQIQKVDVTVAQNNDHWTGGQQQQANFEQTRQNSGKRNGSRKKNQEATGEGGVAIQQVSATTVSPTKSSEVDFFA